MRDAPRDGPVDPDATRWSRIEDRDFEYFFFVFGGESGQEWPQERIAECLHLTIDQVKNAVRRLKAAFAAAVREVVAEYTDSDESFRNELDELSRFLESQGFWGLPASSIRSPPAREDSESGN